MKLKVLRWLEDMFFNAGAFFESWANSIDANLYERLKRSMKKQQRKRMISKPIYDVDYLEAMEVMHGEECKTGVQIQRRLYDEV